MKTSVFFVLLLAASTNAVAQDCTSSLTKELLERKAKDQSARKALTAEPRSKELNEAALAIDRENTIFMRRVLAKCGWPKKSIVGAEAAKAAWLLTQHADMDPEYQVLASRQLKYAVYAKEAEPWDLAVLVDRNRVLTDQPQVYGMQFFSDPEGTIEFYDIVSPAKLDERRKEIGLPSFYCWVSSLSKDSESAKIRWPTGVAFQYSECKSAP